MILDNIIRFIIYINTIITKISLIYKTEEELRQLRFENNNNNLMLKYSYEELINEKTKRIESDNRVLELRQLYLRKLLEEDNNEKIIKLENINFKYHKLNLELLKKVNELNKTIITNNNDYKNKFLKLEKIIIIKTDKYNDLDNEFKKNLDDYFNLKILVEEKYYNIKHLQFLLKKAYCNNRMLRIKKDVFIQSCI
jgi:hypothetical protein